MCFRAKLFKYNYNSLMKSINHLVISELLSAGNYYLISSCSSVSKHKRYIVQWNLMGEEGASKKYL